MDRHHPALVVEWPSRPSSDVIDLLLAALDDDGPTGVEDRDKGVTVFFASAERRDRALEHVRAFAADVSITAVAVSDEAWAERSQASLAPVRVESVIVRPPWSDDAAASSSSGDIVITIVPSMGFGTGHHPSTRLCLQLLQTNANAHSVLDVGTGSGVLAIAAWQLGATRIVGIDVDDDALTSARENVDLNGAQAAVTLEAVDLAQANERFHGGFDLVIANLTGAMVVRLAAELASLVVSHGTLIVSGFQTDEEASVTKALTACGLQAVARADEEHWVALRLTTEA